MSNLDELHKRKQLLEDEYKIKIEELVNWDREFYRHHTTYQHFNNPKELFARHMQHKELMLAQREKIDAFYLNKINDLQYEVDLINCNLRHDKKISELIHSYRQTKGGLYTGIKILDKWDILNYKNISRIDYIAINNLYREIDLLKKKATTQLTVIHNQANVDIKKIKKDRVANVEEIHQRINAIREAKDVRRAQVLEEYEKELTAAITESKFDQKSPRYFKEVRALVGNSYKDRVLRNENLREQKVQAISDQLEKFKNEKEGATNKLCDIRLNKYESKYQYLLNKQNKRVKIINDDFNKSTEQFTQKIQAVAAEIKSNDDKYDKSTNELYEKKDAIVTKAKDAIKKLETNYETKKADLEKDFRAAIEAHQGAHREKDIEFQKREEDALREHEKDLQKARIADRVKQQEIEQQKHEYVLSEEENKKIAHDEFQTTKFKIDKAIEELVTVVDRYNKKRDDLLSQEDKRFTGIIEKIKSTDYAPKHSVSIKPEQDKFDSVSNRIHENEREYNSKLALATDIANNDLASLRDEFNVSKTKAGNDREQVRLIETEYAANVNRINASIKKKDDEIKVIYVEKLKAIEKELHVVAKKLEEKKQLVAAADYKSKLAGKKLQDAELKKATDEHINKTNVINKEYDALISKHEHDIKKHHSTIEIHDKKLFENLKKIENKFKGLHDTLKVKAMESEFEKIAASKISLERTHDQEYEKAVQEAEKTYRTKLASVEKKFQEDMKAQEITNKKEIDGFEVEAIVKKADKVRNDANVVLKKQIDELNVQFDKVKKQYDANIAVINKDIEELDSHHNTYLSNFEKIIAQDKVRIAKLYDEKIAACEQQLTKIDDTFEIRNKLDAKRYNEYLYELTKEEDSSILKFRKNVVQGEVNEINRQFFEQNPTRIKSEKQTPDIALQYDSHYVHTGFFIGIVILLVGAALFVQAQFKILNRFVNTPNLWNSISNVIWPFSIVFLTIGLGILIPMIFYYIHTTYRGISSRSFQTRFNSKLDYLYYKFKIAETKYKYIQSYQYYKPYVHAKNLYLIERARVQHENLIRAMNADRQNEINRIIASKPEFFYPREEKEVIDAQSNETNFRTELLHLKHEYHLALVSIHQRQLQRYKFYMKKINTSESKLLREQYREEYDLVCKTHVFNDELDIQNEKRRFVNRYNDLCIKYKQVSNDNPIVKLGILKHNKMSEEFGRIEKQTTATLALFNTRLEELERYNVTCGNFDERTRFEERTKFGILLTSVFAILFIWIVVMSVVGIIYFPLVLNNTLFISPLRNVHAVYALVGISFLVLLISLLNTYGNYKNSLNILAPDVDLYRLQEDKIAKLKKLNSAFNDKVSDLTALACEMERRNYGLAHEAYVESAKELELQMQRSDQAHALIHQQIHDYHNRHHQDQILAHEAAVKGVHDMYADQSQRLREQYNDIITRQQLAFEKYLMVLKGELGEDALNYAANEVYKVISQHSISENLRNRINSEVVRQAQVKGINVAVDSTSTHMGIDNNDAGDQFSDTGVQDITGVSFQLPNGTALNNIKFNKGEFIIPDGSSLAIGKFITNDKEPISTALFYTQSGEKIADVHFIPSLEGSKTVSNIRLVNGQFVGPDGIPFISGQFIGSSGETIAKVSFVGADGHTVFGDDITLASDGTEGLEQAPVFVEEPSRHVIIIHKRDDNGNWVKNIDKVSDKVSMSRGFEGGTSANRTKKIVVNKTRNVVVNASDDEDAAKTKKVVVNKNEGAQFKTMGIKLGKTRKVVVDKEDVI